MALSALVSHECDQGEQPQQRWGCSGDGQVVPLPLWFHAQVCSNLFTGDFKLPTLHEGLQDVNWTEQEIRAEQRLGGELPFGIADGHPAYGKRREVSVRPDRSLRNDLDLPVGLPVPAIQRDALPARL